VELDSRLVVTGAGGQLGRALANLVDGAILLDRKALDVTDRDEVKRVLGELRPTIIVHGAAFTGVDAAESDPEAAWAVNVEGTRAVAEAAVDADAILVYPSSDYVFSGARAEPYHEECPTDPISFYGATKLQGEQAAAEVDRHLIIRTSWVFGDGHNFIRAILDAARKRPGQALAVVDDQRGRPTHAGDLAVGILELFERKARGTFHLAGSGEPGTWADLAEAALEAAGRVERVRRVSTAEYDAGRPTPGAPRPPNSVLDCARAASLGVALRPWREAVKAYAAVA
jgi:dTDP-4-dehydrorhamnose 3,5-epimerase